MLQPITRYFINTLGANDVNGIIFYIPTTNLAYFQQGRINQDMEMSIFHTNNCKSIKVYLGKALIIFTQMQDKVLFSPCNTGGKASCLGFTNKTMGWQTVAVAPALTQGRSQSCSCCLPPCHLSPFTPIPAYPLVLAGLQPCSSLGHGPHGCSTPMPAQ